MFDQFNLFIGGWFPGSNFVLRPPRPCGYCRSIQQGDQREAIDGKSILFQFRWILSTE